jgi:hypothetical protein
MILIRKELCSRTEMRFLNMIKSARPYRNSRARWPSKHLPPPNLSPGEVLRLSGILAKPAARGERSRWPVRVGGLTQIEFAAPPDQGQNWNNFFLFFK